MLCPASLTLKPLAAKLAKDKDFFTKQDPYLIVKIGAQKRRTKTHQNGGKNPTWSEALVFDLNGTEQMVDIDCFDEDFFTSDDFIANCTFTIQELVQRPSGQNWFRMTRKGGKNGGELLVCWDYRPQAGNGYAGAQQSAMMFNSMAMQQPMPYQQPFVPTQQNSYVNQFASQSYQSAMNYQQPPPPQQQYYPQQPPQPQQPYYHQQPPMAPQPYYQSQQSMQPPPYQPQPSNFYDQQQNFGGYPNSNQFALNAFQNGINNALTPPPPPDYMRGMTGPNGTYGGNIQSGYY